MRSKIGALLGILVTGSLLLSSCSSAGANSSSSTASKKNLTVLTYANWNPFEYIDKGRLVGFDIDLINALAGQVGYKCQVKNSGWDQMFAELQNKSADMGISGITITNSREQTYDFSSPYFISRQSVVVKKNSDIKAVSQIKSNKLLGVQNGSTGQDAVEKLIGKSNPDIKKYTNGLQYEALINGEINAAVGDDTSNQSFLKNNSNADLTILKDDGVFAPEDFGIMYPKGTTYKTKFDGALKTLLKNGKYRSIYKKWFKVNPDLSAIENASTASGSSSAS